MDYAFLRKEGIRELERMTGKQWTDFNAHDPGITILEQVCYALTDLSYRAAYKIPDLLAHGGGDTYENLHPPAEILTCRPVTAADLRRLVIDVPGVRNAWVEPLDESEVPLYYHRETEDLSLHKEPSPSEQVKLRGLYRVLFELAAGDPFLVHANVVCRLHDNRGLCEDFVEIKRLTPQLIQVNATVEIGPSADAELARRQIIQTLADVISPPVPFATLEEMLKTGRSIDEIFDGPRLSHGFITDEALDRATRRTAVNTSDLIRAMMDVQGVRAVSFVRIGVTDPDPTKQAEPTEPWSLAVEDGHVAKLYAAKITVRRDGKIILPPVTIKAASPASPPVASGGGDLAMPAGRDRKVGRYRSIQHHFPAIYGIGDLGLLSSETPERKAQAKQLKAYLMFFEQLMANYLAQLAHVNDLFSFDRPELRTYFEQQVDHPALGLDAIRAPDGPHKKDLATIAEELEIGALAPERKSRFLNHLLARFAETIDDHGPSATASEDLVKGKQAFLRRYPRLSGARGTAMNYLKPRSAASVSGLEERLRLKLGLVDSEPLLVIEHILLRPMPGDEQQEVPLLSTALQKDPYSLQPTKDPYSLQLTFAFPGFLGRFADPELRDVVELTVRAETPAHLTPYVRWMSQGEWSALVEAYDAWVERRREYVAEALRLNLNEIGS
ncbi:MAG TPA: hypothetical protein VE093_09825 [Polyangiaceae bacterium]|nr:hypothetical protein [Polyangiaceae bacterium]